MGEVGKISYSRETCSSERADPAVPACEFPDMPGFVPGAATIPFVHGYRSVFHRSQDRQAG